MRVRVRVRVRVWVWGFGIRARDFGLGRRFGLDERAQPRGAHALIEVAHEVVDGAREGLTHLEDVAQQRERGGLVRVRVRARARVRVRVRISVSVSVSVRVRARVRCAG